MRGLSMSEVEMTDRVIRAIENPYVTIIGHPTGALVGAASRVRDQP